MPQLPAQVQPASARTSTGLNDIYGPTKAPVGADMFHMNVLCQGDVRNRRAGRNPFFLQNGSPVMMLASLGWDDGNSTLISTIGPDLYMLDVSYTYRVGFGIRLILQSPDLNYWSCAPNTVDAIPRPQVTAAPTASPQTADLVIAAGNSLIFDAATQFIQLDCDQAHNGWFTRIVPNGTALNLVTSDIVFTQASGYSLKIADVSGNTWRFSIDNNGFLSVTTV